MATQVPVASCSSKDELSSWVVSDGMSCVGNLIGSVR